MWWVAEKGISGGLHTYTPRAKTEGTIRYNILYILCMLLLSLDLGSGAQKPPNFGFPPVRPLHIHLTHHPHFLQHVARADTSHPSRYTYRHLRGHVQISPVKPVEPVRAPESFHWTAIPAIPGARRRLGLCGSPQLVAKNHNQRCLAGNLGHEISLYALRV
jgi:hypothetical protein